MSDFLTLREAAERLGVHYMTAYRYVRLGQLVARKEGGTWRVAEGDLNLFQQDNASESSEPVSRRTAPWSARLRNRLLDADEAGCWKIIEGALTAGLSPLDVYCDVIVPALRSIGDGWAEGEVGIAEEHVASGLVARLVGRLGPRFNRRGRRRGLVVVVGPPTEMHSLNLAMVSDALRWGGYAALDLGSNLPVDAFEEELAKQAPVEAVCIGVLNPAAIAEAPQMVASARRAGGSTATIVLGGSAVDGYRGAVALGGDQWADLRSVVAAVETGRDRSVSVSV